MKRWCATEVDSDGVMVPVSFSPFLILVLTKGKWGWSQASCYDEQLVLEGDEYCGNHSKCVNNDDDTRGLTCQCGDGFTAHRPNFGEWGMHYQLAYGSGKCPCLGKQRSFGITSDTQAAET